MTGTVRQDWQFEDRDWQLDDHDWSDKAWMSVTDADLFEAILLRSAKSGHKLEILEWGSGRSTVYYTGLLTNIGVPFRWLSLEYDRDYFRKEVGSQMEKLINHHVMYVEDSTAKDIHLDIGPSEDQVVELVVFNKGRLQPMLRAFREDRHVDMDEYVNFPSQQDRRYDIILVDGRKRRRCLLEAEKLLKKDGVVLLHDAWRPYYHCAFDHFQSGRRIGDILWVGMQKPQSMLDNFLVGLGDNF